jgi:hypothetical protein
LTARDRVAAGLVRSIAALPRTAQRALAGPPRVIDGQRLDPEVQVLLRLRVGLAAGRVRSRAL